MASRLIEPKGVFDFVEASRIFRRRGLRAEFWLAGKPDDDNPLSIDPSYFFGKIRVDQIPWSSSRFTPNYSSMSSFVLPSYYPRDCFKSL